MELVPLVEIACRSGLGLWLIGVSGRWGALICWCVRYSAEDASISATVKEYKVWLWHFLRDSSYVLYSFIVLLRNAFGGVSRAPCSEGLSFCSQWFFLISELLCISHSKMLAKWFYPTRLETRTKESNLCASMWAINPYAKWKWQLVYLRQRPTTIFWKRFE